MSLSVRAETVLGRLSSEVAMPAIPARRPWKIDAMRRHSGAFPMILALALALMSGAALPVSAQTGGVGRNVTATGRTMPPPGSRASDAAAKPAGAPTSASINTEMLKAQKASDTRNKNWDSRMRKTMGSICSGC